jgi:uncharacterized protein (DUF697 family)
MFKIPWDEIWKSVDEASTRSFHSIFDSLDGLEAEVQGLIDKDLDLYREKVAEDIIEDASRKTALIGGGAALPDLLPLAGWTTFIGAVAADFALTLRTDLSMLMKLAYLYGQDVSREERKKQAVALLAAVGGGKAGKGTIAGEASKLMGMIGTKHISRKLLIRLGRELGERFFRKKLVKLIPGVGILLSGGVNYYSTRYLGDCGQDYFIDNARENETAASASDDMQIFHRVYLSVLSNMAKLDGNVSDSEIVSLKDSMLMFGYSSAEQSNYLDELHKIDNIQEISSRDISTLSADDCSFILSSATEMMEVSETPSSEQRDYLKDLKTLLKK